MVLDKLPVSGRPTYLDYSRARAYCACSRCGWGLFGHFYSLFLFSPLSPSLWETARYRLKYCLKGPLNPKQPTNQPTCVQGHSQGIKVIIRELRGHLLHTVTFLVLFVLTVPTCLFVY